MQSFSRRRISPCAVSNRRSWMSGLQADAQSEFRLRGNDDIESTKQSHKEKLQRKVAT